MQTEALKKKPARPHDEDSYGDFCKAMREHRKEQRSAAYDFHHQRIQDMGVPHEAKNFGHHLILRVDKKVADFWPASGKWRIRKPDRWGTGLDFLLRLMGWHS
jgi:hypothetical protein